MIKSMVVVFLNGQMEGNIQERGFKVKMLNSFIFLGKQHGVGIYHLANREVKVGEWNEGKRIKWYDDKEIDQLKTEGKIPNEANELDRK